MIDSEHQFMNSEYFGQYEDFYDFAEKNRKVAERLEAKFRDVKYKGNMIEYNPNQEAAIDDDDNESDSWEDVDSSGDEGLDEEGGATEKALKKKKDKKREVYKIRRVELLSTGELRLPSGKIAGHKDYFKYYKQKLRYKEEEKPLQRLMIDRAMQRRFIRMSMELTQHVGPGMGGEGRVMIKAYNHMLHKMKRKVEKTTVKMQRTKKREWVRYGFLLSKFSPHSLLFDFLRFVVDVVLGLEFSTESL